MTNRLYRPAATASRRAGNSVAKLRSVLVGSQGRREITANSAWLLSDKIVRALLGLLVGAWVARYLGPEQFGTLAYVLAVVALFLPIANLSADAIVVRNLSQATASASAALGSVLALRLAFGGISWLLVVAAVAITSNGDKNLILLSALIGGMLVFQAADTIDLWFQSQSQSRRTVLAKLVAYTVASGVKITLIVVQAPLVAFGAVTALEAAMSACALFIAYRRFPTAYSWRPTVAHALALVSESWPFILSGLAIVVYMRIDQVMVREILGALNLGVYAAVLPISQFWTVLPMTIAMSVAPFIAKQRLTDVAAYERSLVLLFRCFFYMGVATAVITYATSSWLVPLLFGGAYTAAIPVLDAHAASNMFCFLGIAHGLWLVNERRFAARLYGTLFGGFSSVVLNLILLPRIGVIGAGLSAVVAQAIASFLINAVLDPRGFRLQIEAITFRRA